MNVSRILRRLHTLWVLTQAQIAHRFLSFKTLNARWLKPSTSTRIDRQAASDLRYGLRKARTLSPLDANCLVQTMAAAKLCRQLDLAYTIHLGVHTQDHTVKAHAWLTSGDVLICGDDDLSLYQTLQRNTPHDH